MRNTGIRALIFLICIGLAGCITEPYQSEKQRAEAAEYNAQLGLGYLRQGKNAIALSKLEKAVEQDPDNANAQHYLAQLYHVLGKTEDAKHHFEIALELAPEDSVLQNNYGVFLCARGKYDQAKEVFMHVLEDPLYTARGQLMENIGLCAHQQGNIKIAEIYLKKSLRSNPRSAKSLLIMAQLRFDKQDYTQAREYYYQYLTVARQTPASLWIGILLEHRAGNRNRMSSYSVLLKGKYPDSREAGLLRNMEAKGVL